MPRPAKQRAFLSNSEGKNHPQIEANEDSNSEPEQEIQVDFEGRSPQDMDFHGIKMLLQQLFLKAHVNLSEIANLIIGNNHIGSVIKQSELEGMDDMEEDDPDNMEDVFGVTTIVPLDQKQKTECINQIRQLLSDLVEEHGNEENKRLIQTVLRSNSALLINERLVNIPSQISAPLFESLNEEIKNAIDKHGSSSFDYYIMICKMYQTENTKKNKTNASEVIWSNGEEEAICAEAMSFFEFSVKTESDSGFTGQWLEDDNPMAPYRRILILDAKKLNQIVHIVKTYVS